MSIWQPPAISHTHFDFSMVAVQSQDVCIGILPPVITMNSFTGHCNHVSIQSGPSLSPNIYSDELPLLCCFSQEEASIVENNFPCRLHHQWSCNAVLPLQVKRTYSQGTYRAGAMRQVSLVGAVDEEVGDYFPEFISMLEESPFLEVSGSYSSACVCVFVYI